MNEKTHSISYTRSDDRISEVFCFMKSCNDIDICSLDKDSLHEKSKYILNFLEFFSKWCLIYDEKSMRSKTLFLQNISSHDSWREISRNARIIVWILRRYLKSRIVPNRTCHFFPELSFVYILSFLLFFYKLYFLSLPHEDPIDRLLVMLSQSREISSNLSSFFRVTIWDEIDFRSLHARHYSDLPSLFQVFMQNTISTLRVKFSL